jgi:preprotein translocase subunit SecF
MKKVIKFSNLFVPTVIMSVTIITFGLFGYFTKGFNLGLDFQAGFIEKVRIAPTALSLTYDGAKSVTVTQSSQGLTVVVTGVDSDNQSFSYPYATYPTVGDFTRAIVAIPGVAVTLSAPESTPLKSVFPDSEVLSRLSDTAYRFHYVPADIAPISSDEIRQAISAFPDAAVQVIGHPSDRFFQVRLEDDGTDPQASQNLRMGLNAAFVKAYGEENVAVIGTDFVGSRFSKGLASQATWLVLLTLVLIWAYCTIRFRWDFAVGGVLAILHDALIMVTFIVWTRMSFNSTTIAAILTILGYSINDTVVIFDRIRENMRFHPDMKIVDILNLAQTEILGRTIITSAATMLAVGSLFFFTTGDMKDFAAALLVGMVSGVYSTIYIASAFIAFVGRFRKDGGRMAEKVKAPKEVVSGELV